MRRKDPFIVDVHLSRGVETAIDVPFVGDDLAFILVVPDSDVTIKVNDKAAPDVEFELKACQTIDWNEDYDPKVNPNPFAGVVSKRWFVTCKAAKHPKHRFRIRLHLKAKGD